MTWSDLPDETPIDPSGLTSDAKARGITNRNELNLLEAKNIAPVIAKYLSTTPTTRLAPFDFSWSVKLHKEMFCDVWKWAGVFRETDLNIGSPFYNVRGELYGLLDDLKTWPGFKMPILEQAARLHYHAVAIHPFPNGNGRWSRMLANIWLKKHGSSPIAWPEETIGQQSTIRDEYIAAIRTADNGDYSPLIALHAKYQG